MPILPPCPPPLLFSTAWEVRGDQGLSIPSLVIPLPTGTSHFLSRARHQGNEAKAIPFCTYATFTEMHMGHKETAWLSILPSGVPFGGLFCSIPTGRSSCLTSASDHNCDLAVCLTSGKMSQATPIWGWVQVQSHRTTQRWCNTKDFVRRNSVVVNGHWIWLKGP